jgi:hypothetical protein
MRDVCGSNMPVTALDVIWIWDTSIDPANWKRAVCICPDDGLFYRINSYDDYPIGVFIPQQPNHSDFLKWDSYIECGKYPLELDDYQVDESLKRSNNAPLGKVSAIHAQDICDAVKLQSTISKEVKRLIHAALGCKFP